VIWNCGLTQTGLWCSQPSVSLYFCLWFSESTLGHIKQQNANDSRKMNWKKCGIVFGLLCCIFSLFPYKGWIKLQTITDRLFGQRTEILPKKQDCQPVGKNKMSVHTSLTLSETFSLRILLLAICLGKMFRFVSKRNVYVV
jgi:hypothetical protein